MSITSTNEDDCLPPSLETMNLVEQLLTAGATLSLVVKDPGQTTVKTDYVEIQLKPTTHVTLGVTPTQAPAEAGTDDDGEY